MTSPPPLPLDDVPKKVRFLLMADTSFMVELKLTSSFWSLVGGNRYEIQVLIGLIGHPGAKTLVLKLIRYLLNLDIAPMP